MDLSKNGGNILEREEGLLISLVEQHAERIANNSTDGLSLEQNREAWLAIANEFQAISGIARDPQSLYKQYQNLKRQPLGNVGVEIMQPHRMSDERSHIQTEREEVKNDSFVTGIPTPVRGNAIIASNTKPIGHNDSIERNALPAEPEPPLRSLRNNERSAKLRSAHAEDAYWINKEARSASRHVRAKQLYELRIEKLKDQILITEQHLQRLI